MSYDRNWFEVVRHPLKPRRLRVEQVTRVSPRIQRVTLGGADLAGFTSRAPEDHVKLFFPQPGRERPDMPSVGPLGIVLPKLGGSRPIARDYTPLERGEQDLLSFDFFLHGTGGVAERWAAQAKPGQELGVLGPRGSYVAKRRFGRYLLVGDETALPEIEGRLRLLEAGATASVVLLVEGPEEQRELHSDAKLDVRWVHRKTDAGSALVGALDGAVGPGFDGFVWLAGETSEVRRVYRYVVQDQHVESRRVHASGHWKRGVVNHDHHEPIETSEQA